METSENRAQGGPSADGGSRSPHLWPAGPSALLRPPYIPTQVLQPLGGLLPGHSSLSSALPILHGRRGLSCHAVAERSGKGPEAKGQAFRLPICLSRSAASSGVARGRTPGSLKLVRSRVPITKKNRMPPTTGMAGVIFTARYGQLPTGWEGGRGGEKEKKDNVSNRQ